MSFLLRLSNFNFTHRKLPSQNKGASGENSTDSDSKPIALAKIAAGSNSSLVYQTKHEKIELKPNAKTTVLNGIKLILIGYVIAIVSFLFFGIIDWNKIKDPFCKLTKANEFQIPFAGLVYSCK